MKKTLTLTGLFLLAVSIFAQVKLDVFGDAKIIGHLELLKAPSDSSVFIGAMAGINDIGKNKNTFVGSRAGKSNTNGIENTFLGWRAGRDNTIGNYNTFIGAFAGERAGGEGNTFVGYDAGSDSTVGNYNTFIGSYAGINNETGQENTFLGSAAGNRNTIGEYNTYVGDEAGESSSNGTRNTYIGNDANKDYADSLDRSIAIGHNATVECHNCAAIGGTGADAVKVGIGVALPTANLHVKQVGVGEEGLSLENDTDTDTWSLEIGNDDLHIYFNGVDKGQFDNTDGAYVNVSDRTLKTEIKPIEDGILEKLIKLNATTYFFKDDKEKRWPSCGFIAQEVQKIFPTIANKFDDNSNYMGIKYDQLGVVTIKAIQELYQKEREQTKVIEDLIKEVKATEKMGEVVQQQTEQIEELNAEVVKLKTLVEKLITNGCAPLAFNTSQ